MQKKDLLPEKLVQALKEKGLRLEVYSQGDDLYYFLDVASLPKRYNCYQVPLEAVDWCGGICRHARNSRDVMLCLYSRLKLQYENSYLTEVLMYAIDFLTDEEEDANRDIIEETLSDAEYTFVKVLGAYIESLPKTMPDLVWDFATDNVYTEDKQ